MATREQSQTDLIERHTDVQQDMTEDAPFDPNNYQVLKQSAAADFLHMNDPRNYKFLPSEFTQQIRAAGTKQKKSEGIANLLSFE